MFLLLFFTICCFKYVFSNFYEIFMCLFLFIHSKLLLNSLFTIFSLFTFWNTCYYWDYFSKGCVFGSNPVNCTFFSKRTQKRRKPGLVAVNKWIKVCWNIQMEYCWTEVNKWIKVGWSPAMSTLIRLYFNVD